MNEESRAPAFALILAPLLMVGAMTHHPSTQSQGLAERLAEIASEAAISRSVHGLLILLMLVVFWGLASFSQALGWRSSRVRLATLVYGCGVVFLMGAAVVSGFLVTGLARHYAEEPLAAMEAAVPLFRLCFETNHALAELGTIGTSAGIFLWSWVLLGQARPWTRVLASLGVLVGVAPVAGLFVGALRLDVHGMLLVVVGQAVWTVGAGVWLLTAVRRSRAT